MATVYKRVNSKNYYYRFTVNGVEENRSCHTDNYNTAVKVMNARIKEVSQAAGPRDLTKIPKLAHATTRSGDITMYSSTLTMVALSW